LAAEFVFGMDHEDSSQSTLRIESLRPPRSKRDSRLRSPVRQQFPQLGCNTHRQKYNAVCIAAIDLKHEFTASPTGQQDTVTVYRHNFLNNCFPI
jgi:hypothetical protein